MTPDPTRREFLTVLSTSATAAAIATALPARPVAGEAAPAPAAEGGITKALIFAMVPGDVSYEDRFRMGVDAGFEAVEAYTTPDEKEAEKIKKAAEAAHLRIHSVMNQAHWEFPLSSP